MIDFNKALKAFDRYVSAYDQSIPSIRLKVIHTYEVIKCSQYICKHLNLNEQQTTLASLIALLHDIGRFEQWMRYESFNDHKTIDHALFSSQLLFDEGLIREFIEESTYDSIIKTAIEQHNKYKVDEGIDESVLLYVHMIRDADKLDNFRVKEEETIETLLFDTLEHIVQEDISDKIYEQFSNKELIYAPYRKTHIDIWLSYIAFIFDLYFDISYQYIDEHQYIDMSFNRIHPVKDETLKQYNELRDIAIHYIKQKVGCYE